MNQAIAHNADSYLVVGAESTIGSALRAIWSSRGADVFMTTRRADRATSPDRIYFDAERLTKFSLPVVPKAAFFCIGQSNFVECERNPQAAYNVNVNGVTTVAKTLLDAGSFVVFLSSSAVFDGDTPWPKESAPLSPTTEYGRQKAEAERRLLELDNGKGNVAIVRLTKVLGPESPIVQRFLRHLRNRETFEAFSNLYLSPISLRYVIESLCAIAERRASGVFHLSGDMELSYAEFARRLARELDVPDDAVKESDVASAATAVLFKPRYPGLGMRETLKMLNVAPESVVALLSRLLQAT